MIIHITYVKPALTRRFTALDCGCPHFVEALGQVPTLPSHKSGPAYKLLLSFRFQTVNYLKKGIDRKLIPFTED